METLNERIKQLRKERGLTQSQLADLLCVTDKAVSKWEVGESNPDISLLSRLSEIFGVTIDYLLTGKVQETISLDDMDEEKRATYLIKKDDAVTFEKYGYATPSLLFTEPYYGRGDRKVESLLESIYAQEAKEIFKLCLSKGLSNQNTKRIIDTNGALAVRGDIEKFIRMCCAAGCVEGLEIIDLKHFALGNKTSVQDTVSFHISEGYGPADPGYRVPQLAISLLEELFASKNLSKEIVKYFADIDFFREGNKKVCLMVDAIVGELYKNKYFDALESLFVKMNENTSYAIEEYEKSIRGSWYTGKHITKNAIYFTNNAHGETFYLHAMVEPVCKALDVAIEQKDFKWIKKFNEYNRIIKERIPEISARVLSDKEIRLMELEASNAPLEELIPLKFTSHHVLNLLGFLSSDYGLTATDKAEMKSQKIQQLKQLSGFVKDSYLSGYELIVKCLLTKNRKLLKEFADELGFNELQNAIEEHNDESVKEIAAQLFIPSEDNVRRIKSAKASSLNIHVMGATEDVAATELARKQAISEARMSETKRFIADRENSYRNHLNLEVYKSLLNLQFSNIPLDEIYSSLTLKDFDDVKQNALNERIESLEDGIEQLTHRKALEKSYNKITEELSKDYLLSELERGESDKVVVLICKRLQILLEYKFGYTGDLFTMIDTLVERNMQLHNCSDDEDNNYNQYLEEDRVSLRRIELLHKLRMKRNNIVHAELKEVEMSLQEIKDCIDLVEILSK